MLLTEDATSRVEVRNKPRRWIEFMDGKGVVEDGFGPRMGSWF
jgi:hypothetical protein